MVLNSSQVHGRVDRDSQLPTLIREATPTSASEVDVGCYSASALTCSALKYGALSSNSHGTVISGTAISYNREGKKPFHSGKLQTLGLGGERTAELILTLPGSFKHTRTHGRLSAHKSVGTLTLKDPKLRPLLPKKPKVESQHMTAYRNRSESPSHDSA